MASQTNPMQPINIDLVKLGDYEGVIIRLRKDFIVVLNFRKDILK